MKRNVKELQFIEGASPLDPPLKPFLKEGFKNPKNFQKDIFINSFLKVLEGGLGGTSFKKFLPVAPL